MEKEEQNSKSNESISSKENNEININFVSLNETKSIMNKKKYQSFKYAKEILCNNKNSNYYLKYF